jgi:branched-chain amino acid transport system permease protein
MIQFLINGLITGVLYSLLAIGFALVYNTTRIFHIAAAALYVVAAYAFYVFAVKLGLPLVLALSPSVIYLSQE